MTKSTKRCIFSHNWHEFMYKKVIKCHLLMAIFDVVVIQTDIFHVLTVNPFPPIVVAVRTFLLEFA